jgi:hypothetical protein
MWVQLYIHIIKYVEYVDLKIEGIKEMGRPFSKISHATHLLFTNPNMQIDDVQQ